MLAMELTHDTTAIMFDLRVRANGGAPTALRTIGDVVKFVNAEAPLISMDHWNRVEDALKEASVDPGALPFATTLAEKFLRAEGLLAQ
jgi:hypothetical protein